MPHYKITYTLDNKTFASIQKHEYVYVDAVARIFREGLPVGYTDYTCEMISSIIVEREGWEVGEWVCDRH